MKRILLSIVCLMIVVVSVAYSTSLWNGQRVSQISSVQSASASVLRGTGLFHGIMVVGDGTNAITINIYDSLTATGTKLIPTNTVISGAASPQAISYSPPLKYTTGVYVNVSVAGGGTCVYMVNYDN